MFSPYTKTGIMYKNRYTIWIALLFLLAFRLSSFAQVCPNSSNHITNGDFSTGLTNWSQYGNVNAMVLPINSGCIATCLAMPATNNSNSGVIQSVVIHKDTCYDLCYCVESPNGGGNSKVTVALVTPSVTQAQLLSGSFTPSQAQILDSYVVTTQFPAYQRCPGTVKATGNFTGFVIINETFGLIGSDIRVDNVCLQSRLPCPTDPCDSTQASFGYTTFPGLIAQFNDMSVSAAAFPVSSWSWNFGDPASGASNTSTLQNPSHTFTAPGWYYVCLYIAAGQPATGMCHDTICMDVYIPPSDPCDSLQAAFTYSATGTSVQFTDASTSTASSPVVSWTWNFGDPPSGAANTSTLQNPVHVYSSSGWYLVCLIVASGQNGAIQCRDTLCMDVYVPPSTPCDSVVANFSSAATGLTATFTDLSLTPSGGTIASWTWNFGDPASGVANTSNMQNPVHVYTAPGYYVVCLYIAVVTSDGLSCQDTICKDVYIPGNNSDPCDSLQAWFTASGNLIVNFSDLSTLGGGLISSGYSWNFGDPASGANNTSNLQNPVHNFTAPGIYLVCLIVNGYIPGTIFKCADTVCRDVLVSQAITGQREQGVSGLKIFPNPGNGRFAIENNGVNIKRVRVFDATGQLVLDEPYLNAPFRLPESCGAGVYLIRIETTEGPVTRKLSVQPD
jgi:PKD repeat protein